MLGQEIWRNCFGSVEAFIEARDVDRAPCQVAGAALADALHPRMLHCALSYRPPHFSNDTIYNDTFIGKQVRSKFARNFLAGQKNLESAATPRGFEGRPRQPNINKFNAVFCNYISKIYEFGRHLYANERSSIIVSCSLDVYDYFVTRILLPTVK